MKKNGYRIITGLALSLAFLMFAGSGAVAAEYPDAPVKLIVTYPPGGATDFQARIVTMKTEQYLGQPMVIINKPGGGGMVGWNWAVSSASKDGYELITYNLPHFIAQSIVYPKKAKYTIDKFEPIGNWGTDPAVLIVPKSSPFNSVQDLVDYAKKHPETVTFSGAGLYVGHHIAMLQLDKAAGIKTRYIPHQGGVPALLAVVSGEVMAGFNNLSDAFRSQDRVKILAVADMERSPFLPDVKTLKEQGFDVDDTSNNLRGIAAPAGTPPQVVKKLEEAFLKMTGDKGIAEKMKLTGSGVKVMTGDEVKAMWKKMKKSLEEILKDLRQE
jgi:tripartite-type tricarboxylate transporter receptor subunit TctC